MGKKFAVVTGASRGIGRSIVLELAQRNYDVVINYLSNSEAAKKTRNEAQKLGARAWCLQANVGEQAEVKELLKQIRDLGHKNIDVLIHNAAIGTFKDTLSIRHNQMDLAFRVNVQAMLWLCQQVVPQMISGGKIIAISSIGSIRTIPYYGILGPTKAALESLVRYLAVELRPKGINVNAVSGGFIQTDALNTFPNIESLIEAAIKRTPAGRIGQPEDIASIVGFLVSDQADWICGQIILADGGFSLL